MTELYPKNRKKQAFWTVFIHNSFIYFLISKISTDPSFLIENEENDFYLLSLALFKTLVEIIFQNLRGVYLKFSEITHTVCSAMEKITAFIARAIF